MNQYLVCENCGAFIPMQHPAFDGLERQFGRNGSEPWQKFARVVRCGDCWDPDPELAEEPSPGCGCSVMSCGRSVERGSEYLRSATHSW